jgi:hypothetical protein
MMHEMNRTSGTFLDGGPTLGPTIGATIMLTIGAMK